MFTTMSKHFSFRTMKTRYLLHHVHQLNVFQDPRANDKFFHSWKIDIAAPLLIIFDTYFYAKSFLCTYEVQCYN